MRAKFPFYTSCKGGSRISGTFSMAESQPAADTNSCALELEVKAKDSDFLEGLKKVAGAVPAADGMSCAEITSSGDTAKLVVTVPLTKVVYSDISQPKPSDAVQTLIRPFIDSVTRHIERDGVQAGSTLGR